MKLKNKHREMQLHLQSMIDSGSCLNNWGGVIISDDMMREYIRHESTGSGSPHPALLDAKKSEEILIQQWWSEMADHWAAGFGWWYVWRDNLSCYWSERKGDNIWIRKLLSIRRTIGNDFIGALISFAQNGGMTPEQLSGYLARRGCGTA